MNTIKAKGFSKNWQKKILAGLETLNKNGGKLTLDDIDNNGQIANAIGIYEFLSGNTVVLPPNAPKWVANWMLRGGYPPAQEEIKGTGKKAHRAVIWKLCEENGLTEVIKAKTDLKDSNISHDNSQSDEIDCKVLQQIKSNLLVKYGKKHIDTDEVYDQCEKEYGV